MKSAKGVIVAAAFVAIVGVAERSANAGFCPTWGCGGNSATVGDGIVFDELNVLGLANDAGIRIRSVRLPDATPGRLEVTGHQLKVYPFKPKSQPIADPVGTIITIAHADGRAYELKIEKAGDCGTKYGKDCLTFWASPEQSPVPYYTFLVKKISQRWTASARSAPTKCEDDDRPVDRGRFKESICVGKNLEPEVWTGIEASALTFEGDHYDRNTKQVSPGGKGWFNLACAGTAAAKMHLLRHSEAGSIKTSPKRTTTMLQRTAMLRMLTADYCGNGSTFTIDGQPLLYGDVRKWYPKPPLLTPADPRIGTFEAAWGTNGKLLCLNEPRRFCKATIEQVCSTELGTPWTAPPCPANGTLPVGTYVISANPKPASGPPPACITHWP
jgi:hypothetical protein